MAERQKKETEAKKITLVEKEKAKAAASEALWGSLSEEQRKGYLKKARVSVPAGVNPSATVSLILAKDLAEQSALASSDA